MKVAQATTKTNVHTVRMFDLPAVASYGLSPGAISHNQGICDASGNYILDVPLGMPLLTYNNLQLSAVDPVADNTLSSIVSIDLSSLAARGVFTAPTLRGMCTDSDAGSPDSDDPDCD
ncbi:MAG: hypothetical protein KGI35_01230 [Burkholderiales bacterium]|nr:hypothetical protein [Burkholderiales bacterium]